MANNLIPVIADCLGIRIGEEFDVNIPYMGKTRWCRYKLTNKGLVRKRETGEWWSSPGFLERLICGDYEISKLPFEPKDGERYFSYAGNDFGTLYTMWTGTATNYLHKATGCIFRTEAEAIVARPAKYKELTGKEWQE